MRSLSITMKSQHSSLPSRESLGEAMKTQHSQKRIILRFWINVIQGQAYLSLSTQEALAETPEVFVGYLLERHFVPCIGA